MKQGILSAAFAALALGAASAASADVHVVINPFGFVAVAPPVIYQPRPYYAAPPGWSTRDADPGAIIARHTPPATSRRRRSATLRIFGL